jgi:hypothetical protein
MFRASASNHRQHKHLSCRPCYRHALYQYAFALKSSELWTKNVLEYLATRPNTSSKKLRIKPITRIVHTTSMQKSLKTTMNPLWTTSSYLTTQIRNLSKSVEIPTISWNLYSSFTNSEHSKIWILETSYKEILILSIIRISTIKRECWLQQLSKNVQPPSNIEHY